MKKKILIILIPIVILLVFYFVYNLDSLVYKRTINKNIEDITFIKTSFGNQVNFKEEIISIKGKAHTSYERFVIHGAADTFENDYDYNLYVNNDKLYLSFQEENLKINDIIELNEFYQLLELFSLDYDIDNFKVEKEINGGFIKTSNITYSTDELKISYSDEIYEITYKDLKLKVLNINENGYQINIECNDKEYILTKTITSNGKDKFTLVFGKVNVTIVKEENNLTIDVLSNLKITLNYELDKISKLESFKESKNKDELYLDVPAYRFYLINIKGKV